MKQVTVRNNSGDDWKTPDDFYKKLDEVYHFDFDPCPYHADFDGLKIEWGGRTSLTRLTQENLKKRLSLKHWKKAVRGRSAFYFSLFQLQQLYSMM